MATPAALAQKRADANASIEEAMHRLSEKHGVPVPPPAPTRDPDMRDAIGMYRVARFLNELADKTGSRPAAQKKEGEAGIHEFVAPPEPPADPAAEAREARERDAKGNPDAEAEGGTGPGAGADEDAGEGEDGDTPDAEGGPPGRRKSARGARRSR